jgi:hypothetical protein
MPMTALEARGTPETFSRHIIHSVVFIYQAYIVSLRADPASKDALFAVAMRKWQKVQNYIMAGVVDEEDAATPGSKRSRRATAPDVAYPFYTMPVSRARVISFDIESLGKYGAVPCIGAAFVDVVDGHVEEHGSRLWRFRGLTPPSDSTGPLWTAETGWRAPVTPIEDYGSFTERCYTEFWATLPNAAEVLGCCFEPDDGRKIDTFTDIAAEIDAWCIEAIDQGLRPVVALDNAVFDGGYIDQGLQLVLDHPGLNYIYRTKGEGRQYSSIKTTNTMRALRRNEAGLPMSKRKFHYDDLHDLGVEHDHRPDHDAVVIALQYAAIVVAFGVV